MPKTNISCLGLFAVLVVAMAVGGCQGGSDESGGSSASSPTAPSASATCSPPVVTVCGSNGPNDGRPGIGQVTVSAGGAPSCRVALREAIPISFTIVNPNSGFTWEIQTNARHSVSPSSGSASSAGPFQATVQFNSFGGDNRTDDSFRITTSGGLGCTVPIHGRN